MHLFSSHLGEAYKEPLAQARVSGSLYFKRANSMSSTMHLGRCLICMHSYLVSYNHVASDLQMLIMVKAILRCEAYLTHMLCLGTLKTYQKATV